MKVYACFTISNKLEKVCYILIKIFQLLRALDIYSFVRVRSCCELPVLLPLCSIELKNARV
jgi:hypothetical protein